MQTAGMITLHRRSVNNKKLNRGQALAGKTTETDNYLKKQLFYRFTRRVRDKYGICLILLKRKISGCIRPPVMV